MGLVRAYQKTVEYATNGKVFQQAVGFEKPSYRDYH
jgi:hypothetical protein